MKAMLEILAVLLGFGLLAYWIRPRNEAEKILKEINKKFSAQKQYDKENKAILYDRRLAIRKLAERLRNERKANADPVANADKPVS
jgi:hypothetical protein